MAGWDDDGMFDPEEKKVGVEDYLRALDVVTCKMSELLREIDRIRLEIQRRLKEQRG